MHYSLRVCFLFCVAASLDLNDIKKMKTDPTTTPTTTTPTTTTTTPTTTTTTPTTTTTTPTTATTTPTTTTTVTTTTTMKPIVFTMVSPGDMLVDCTSGCPTGWKYYMMKCYKKVDTAGTYADALAGCSALGAQLASIGDSSENDALRKEYDTNALVTEAMETWIGLKQTSGTWKWADGSSLSYSNWAPTQPAASAQCGQMITDALTNATYKYQRGFWKTYDCAATSASYICEKAASVQ